MKLVLLPGMDGTGILFEPLLKVLPESLSPVVVSYPGDVALSYSELLQRVEANLPSTEPFIVLGESFSGPIALRVAASCPARLKGIVLCASFASNPVRLFPSVCQSLIRPFIFSLRFLGLRAALAGYSSPSLLEMVREANRAVTPEVLAARARAIVVVNAEDALAACNYPILYLAGSADRVVPKRNYERIKTINQSVKLVVLPAPHLVLQAAPAEAARAITEFAASVSAG
jgi:pimeloyl-[acyl-carrier protein] methyl ester esterase